MNTSPFGARWIASGGQSVMQCGSSQCRHEVGTCKVLKVGPARVGGPAEHVDAAPGVARELAQRVPSQIGAGRDGVEAIGLEDGPRVGAHSAADVAPLGVEQHRDLLRAIARGDPVAAERAMREHLVYLRDLVTAVSSAREEDV